MARQLSLLEAPPTWPLSQATRETGRRGVAEARKALAEAVARAKQAQEAEEATRSARRRPSRPVLGRAERPTVRLHDAA